MFIFLLKEYSNFHVYNCNFFRYLIYQDENNYEIKNNININDYNIIYTNNKKELLQSLNLTTANNVYDITIQKYLISKIIDNYTTNTYDKFNLFYNNKLSLVPKHKIIELFDYNRFPINLKFNNFIQNVIIPVFIQLENNNMNVDIKKLSKYKQKTYNFIISNNINKIYQNYNIFSSTLRPTNNIYNLNFMSLNKSNNERSIITSQFENGFLYEIDFNSYHLSILSKLLNISIPSKYNNWHDYLGCEYYFKTIKLNKIQYKESKIKNFKYLYGFNKNNERNNIKIFKMLDVLSKQIYNNYNSYGFIESPLYKIQNHLPKHMTENKVFNYFVQLYETEISFIILNKLFQMVDDNIKIISYNYDSMLFDINTNYNTDILNNISKLLLKLNMFFSIKIYKNDYSD